MSQSVLKPAAQTLQNPESDRLSRAKNFANELSESRLREMAAAYKKRWTPERRAQKSKMIQAIKPWLHATGPKTPAGKTRASQNAWKDKIHGPAIRDINLALRAQSRFLKMVRLARILRQKGWPEADRFTAQCRLVGHQVTHQLLAALLKFSPDAAWLFIPPPVTVRNNE